MEVVNDNIGTIKIRDNTWLLEKIKCNDCNYMGVVTLYPEKEEPSIIVRNATPGQKSACGDDAVITIAELKDDMKVRSICGEHLSYELRKINDELTSTG